MVWLGNLLQANEQNLSCQPNPKALTTAAPCFPYSIPDLLLYHAVILGSFVSQDLGIDIDRQRLVAVSDGPVLRLNLNLDSCANT